MIEYRPNHTQVLTKAVDCRLTGDQDDGSPFARSNLPGLRRAEGGILPVDH